MDGGVPADDEVTSLTARGGAPGGPGWPVAFTTTHWSVVLTAQDESPAAHEALEKLCRTYWRPIFVFLRRQGISQEEAEDITQGFFASLLEHRNLNAVRKEQGRLRSYLLGALKYFLANERRRGMAIKRGKGQRLIPLEELRADERVDMEPADPVTAEVIYERRWALALLDRVLSRLREEYAGRGHLKTFVALEHVLVGGRELSNADIAKELGMTEGTIKVAGHRLRRRYRELLPDEIAQTVSDPGRIDEEIRQLLSCL
jgi:RNA polymerase sigma-70 factor (ECF subfamily)